MAALLAVEAIETFYGASQALFGVSFAIRHGEALALLGRNGMGKTTAVRSIIGLAPVARGRVVLDGVPVQHWPAFRIARSGVGLVPEGRQVFPALTVRENLVATARPAKDGRTAWTLARVLRLFPALAARQGQSANTLSGGEQQMLAVGRALMTNPRLLILDEATEGLAPLVRAEIWKCLRGLRAEGQSLLLIDKNLAELAPIAERACVLEKGRVTWEGSPAALLADAKAKHRYLGV
jgi:branched-chain amino acid transport system ATP-binding protein